MDGVSALIIITFVGGIGYLCFRKVDDSKKDKRCSVEGCNRPTYAFFHGKPLCDEHIGPN